MALPFLAGIALGSLAVVAYTKRDALKASLTKGAQKAKEVAQTGLEKAQCLTKEASKKSCCCTDEVANEPQKETP
jgi:hypothetical protein